MTHDEKLQHLYALESLQDTDWFDVLLRILGVVATNEGTFFERDWEEAGITKERKDFILREYEKFCEREQAKLRDENGPTDAQLSRLQAQSHLAQEKRVLAEDQIERELKEIGHRSPFRP